LDIEGSGFLYNMVRIIAGSLVEIGKGKRQPDWIAEIIQSKDRTKAGPTAPPQGLFLMNVDY
jgi:tRNA pseudouridine38-40 synthase